jgi:nucleoside-diphosphate-sugar epimerase
LTLKKTADAIIAYDIKQAPSDEAAGKITDDWEAYVVSKVIAHQAATDFVKSHQPAFDLIRILPGFVLGANELNDGLEDMSKGSNGGLMSTALGQIQDGPKLTAQTLLEDVAKAHVLALDQKIVPNAANLIVAGNAGQGVPWDDVADLIKRLYPDEVEATLLKPVSGQISSLTRFDVRSSEEILGYRFASAEPMIKSVLGQWQYFI